jgi:hypothetical protein
MKYLVTPQFSDKLATLAPVALSLVAKTIAAVTKLSLQDLETTNLPSYIVPLGENIYMLNADGVRIMATTTQAGEDIAILFLDIIDYSGTGHGGEGPPRRDPRRNSRANPTLNHTINPIFNHSINPIFNHNVNPIFNHSINPVFNHAINPIFNPSINPRRNSLYDGPFVYDRSNNMTGFTVKASDVVVLLFTLDGKADGFGVRNSVDGYTLFTAENQWVGQLVPAPDDVLLKFGKDNQWTGILV